MRMEKWIKIFSNLKTSIALQHVLLTIKLYCYECGIAPYLIQKIGLKLENPVEKFLKKLLSDLESIDAQLTSERERIL